MAAGDIVIYRQASTGGGSGSRTINVVASANVINPGEPVLIVAGASAVLPNQSNNLLTVPSPFVPYNVAGTGLVGIAETKSTNTSTAAGTVEVVPVNPGTVWMINVKVSADISTQAKYDALVGKRVLIDLTSGNYTMLSSDSALNGCIIQPSNIVQNPGKILFTFAPGVAAQ